MLKISNKKLEYNNLKIVSSDTIIELHADVESYYIGVLHLNDGTKKIIEFVKFDDCYQGRLVIDRSELHQLSNSNFNIVMIDGPMKEETNFVKLDFSLEKINLDVNLKLSNEIEELRTKVKQLESIINNLKSNKILDNINIVNKDYIVSGMIPVAIDNKGNFMAAYPFSDNIREVNGQHAVNGVVKIDSSMIEYHREKTIEKGLDDQADAIVTLSNLVSTVIENQKDIRKRLDQLEIKLETHITNGII